MSVLDNSGLSHSVQKAQSPYRCVFVASLGWQLLDDRTARPNWLEAEGL